MYRRFIVLCCLLWGLPMVHAAEVTVALLDTGFVFSPQDERWFVWKDNCTDHTAICVVGRDVAEDDENPFIEKPTHGQRVFATFTKTIVALERELGRSFDVRIIPVRIESEAHANGLLMMEKGLAFVADQDVDIVNISYGGNFSPPGLEKTIETMHRKGTTFLAASGNDPSQLGLYPARYDAVVGVGALTRDGYIYGAQEATEVLVPVALIRGVVGSSAATAVLSAYTAVAGALDVEDRELWVRSSVHVSDAVERTYQRWGVWDGSPRHFPGYESPTPKELPLVPKISDLTLIPVPSRAAHIFRTMEEALSYFRGRGFFLIPMTKVTK